MLVAPFPSPTSKVWGSELPMFLYLFGAPVSRFATLRPGVTGAPLGPQRALRWSLGCRPSFHGGSVSSFLFFVKYPFKFFVHFVPWVCFFYY